KPISNWGLFVTRQPLNAANEGDSDPPAMKNRINVRLFFVRIIRRGAAFLDGHQSISVFLVNAEKSFSVAAETLDVYLPFVVSSARKSLRLYCYDVAALRTLSGAINSCFGHIVCLLNSYLPLRRIQMQSANWIRHTSDFVKVSRSRPPALIGQNHSIDSHPREIVLSACVRLKRLFHCWVRIHRLLV